MTLTHYYPDGISTARIETNTFVPATAANLYLEMIEKEKEFKNAVAQADRIPKQKATEKYVLTVNFDCTDFHHYDGEYVYNLSKKMTSATPGIETYKESYGGPVLCVVASSMKQLDYLMGVYTKMSNIRQLPPEYIKCRDTFLQNELEIGEERE